MRKRALRLLLPLLAGGCAAANPPAAEGPASAPAATAPESAVYPTVPPQPGPVSPLTLPSPIRRTLPNGLEVVYVPHGSLPIVHATLVIPAGSEVDPATTPGLSAFVAEMLDEGAAGLGALELAATLEGLGAALRTGAGWDGAFVDLHVLSSRLPEALRLMADVATRPDFPSDEVRRIRDERLTELARARDEAATIAQRAFVSLVYGPEHPYGRVPATESTRAIDRDQLSQFHDRFYRPAGSTLILVGMVDPEELHPMVEQAFGGWTGAAPAAATVPAPPEPERTTIYLIDKPGAPQSEIRIGHPGVARSHPDYFPLLVLNTVLGGSFTSRLNTNLREVHGFSYGAGSSFSMRRGAGPFTAASAVFTQKTDSAVVEFFRELERIREEPVTPDELDRAKNYLALGLPRRFETTDDVASQLATLEIHDLTIDFYNDYVDRLRAVTAADVLRVAREYLHPDRAAVVIVGDLTTIEPGLRLLDLGPVEIRETTDFVR